MIPPPPKSTLFPYTTLFRSWTWVKGHSANPLNELCDRLAVAEIKKLRKANSHDLLKDRKSTRLNSSHGYISYAVFCLKKKKKITPLPLLNRNHGLNINLGRL